MKLAFWRKSSPDDEKRVAEATTPASNPLAKVLRRFTAPEPDWSEIEEALLASDVGLVATTALIQAARDGDGASGRARVRAAALNLLGDDPTNLHDEADVVLLVGVNGVGKTTTAAKLA